MVLLKRRKKAARPKRELIGDRILQVDMHGKNARDNMQKLIQERIAGMQELSAKNLQDEMERLESAGFSEHELRVVKGSKKFLPPPSTYAQRLQSMY